MEHNGQTALDSLAVITKMLEGLTATYITDSDLDRLRRVADEGTGKRNNN